MVLHLQVKRFFCQNEACPKKTFAEGFPDLVARYARRTKRVTKRQQQISLNACARIAEKLLKLDQIGISDTTVNRLIRSLPDPNVLPVRVLGVDDWAKRKGQRYGTILVDLERSEVIDLLEDRTAETVAEWLEEHPEIEIVSRDRSQAYAKAISQGASDAVQVADRWHLLHNLGEALSADYECYAHLIQEVILKPAKDETQETHQPDSAPSPSLSGRKKRTLSPIQQAREIRRAYWLAKFDEVHRLHAQGMSIYAIAKETGLQRRTVRKYVRLPELPRKTSPKSGPRIMDPYRVDVREILKSKPISSRELWDQLRSWGFQGSHSTVYKTMVEIRKELGIPPLRSVSSTKSQPNPKSLTANQLA